MAPLTPARTVRRLGTITAVALAAAVATAGPASAHTEVEAEGARALAQNVSLTFSAESESGSAGVTRLEVILPQGITPSDITYEQGPKGWKLVTTSRGYTVSGPKLAVGEDVEYVVTVRQLPDADTLVFKTLQTYSDGQVDRWIELDESGDGHPAPKLELEPAEPGAKPVSPTPGEEVTTAAASPGSASDGPAHRTATPTPSAKAADSTEGDDGVPLVVPIGIGAVLALGGCAWWLKSRRTSSA